MGRAATELWYEPVDMRVCRVLLVEWTHGNSPFLQGIDLRGVLVSTATETLEHRRAARCEDMRKLHQGDKKVSFDHLTEYLDQLETRYGVPGLDCKVMKVHQTVFCHMCGYRDAKRRFPVGETGLCDVYCCTKIMTMVAAMQLVEQGKLRLDDEVAAYLPEFGSVRAADVFDMLQRPVSWPVESRPSHPARSKMCDIDLMTMTSGMPDQLEAAPIQQAVKASGGQAGAGNGAHDLARRTRNAFDIQPEP